MNLKKTPKRAAFYKGASILAFSQIFSALSSFLRNIVIARFVSTEDFGIASTFALTLSLIEMTSNLALDRILVQDENGDSDELLGSVHLLQCARGVITGLILFLAAKPVALLFNLPELVWAYQLIALIPVFKGFTHWDMAVYQRKLDFFAVSMADILPQAFCLALAYVAAKLIGDFRVMLIVILTQAFLRAAVSHYYASRYYRWVFNRELIRKSFNFGWPLLVNGLLLFFIFQADRVVIATFYDMETLGWFSVAFSLTMFPSVIFAKFSGKLMMPLLSANRGDKEKFEYYCNLTNVFCFAAGIFMVGFFSFGGAALLAFCFSERYLVSEGLIVYLGIMQALRIIRVAPTIISNSQAHTKNPLISNSYRSIALLLAIYFGYRGYKVEWIAISGIIGEVIALFVSYYILRLEEFKSKLSINAFLQTIIFFGLSGLYIYINVIRGTSIPSPQYLEDIITALAIGLFPAFILAISHSNIRREVIHLPKKIVHLLSNHKQ